VIEVDHGPQPAGDGPAGPWAPGEGEAPTLDDGSVVGVVTPLPAVCPSPGVVGVPGTGVVPVGETGVVLVGSLPGVVEVGEDGVGDVLDGGAGDVAVAVDEPVPLGVWAVWAGYGLTAAPPLEVELPGAPGAYVVLDVGRTVGSDWVWVRPAGGLGVPGAGVVAVAGALLVVLAADVAPVRPLAVFAALVTCVLVVRPWVAASAERTTIDDRGSVTGAAAGA